MTRTLRIRILDSTATAAPPPEVVSVESDFVVILAALLCALICVVGLIAVARCAWLRRATAVAGAGNPPRQSSLANRGLKKKVLNSLPRFTFVGADTGAGKWSECAICLAEFAAGDEVRVLPQCGHGFHVACIDTWLGSHSSCPSCRSLLAVPRCRRCGQFPAVTAGAAGDTEEKAVDGGNAGDAENVNSVIGASHDNSGYLP